MCVGVIVFIVLSFDTCSSICFVVFFFKQKTAYEMRISDWSSDVCSSDLLSEREAIGPHTVVGHEEPTRTALLDVVALVARRALRDLAQHGVDRKSVV